MPSRRSTPGHDSCPPFRPSAHPRCGLASPLPRLSALGCLTSFACAGPTMPSADCCLPISGEPSSRSPVGQQAGLPGYVWVPSTHRRPIDKAPPPGVKDFVVAGPLVPGVSRLLSGSCSSPRVFVPRVLQPSPRDDALALPFSFGLPCLERGLAPPRTKTCPAHTPGMSRALRRVGSML
jgi:hypothetical protein